MSDSSRKDSTGSHGFFGRMRLFSGKGGQAAGRNRGSEPITKMFRKSSDDKEDAMPSVTGRDLGQYGYDLIEMSDGNRIYIPNTPESAIFSENEVVIREEEQEEDPPRECIAPAPKGEMSDDDIDEPFIDEESLIIEQSEEFRIMEAEPLETGAADEVAEPSVSERENIAGLFDNVPRGSNGFVETGIGIVQNGEVRKTDVPSLDDYGKADTEITASADDAIFIDNEINEDYVDVKIEASAPKDVEEDLAAADEPEEILRIGPKEETMVEDEVPEVFVPKVEDVTEEAVSDEVVEAAEVIPMLPAPAQTLAICAPVATDVSAYAWDVSEDAADSYGAFMSIEPDYSAYSITAETVWDIDGQASDAFLAFGALVPEYPTPTYEAPAWDVSDEASESFVSHIASVPEFEKVVIVPERNVTEEAAESFVSYSSSVPEFESITVYAPAWDVSDEASESFVSHIASVPEFEKVVIVPEWNVTDGAADSFVSFCASVPEFESISVDAPIWDISEDAYESFVAFQSLNDSCMMEEYIAKLPQTMSIEVEDLERPEESFLGSNLDMTQVPFALTGSTDAGVDVDFRNDDSYDRSNIEINPEPKVDDGRQVRTSRFVFMDGRLQKITNEPVEVGDLTDPEGSFEMEYEAAPEVSEESFRMPLKIEVKADEMEELKPRSANLVAKQVEGVNFSFGQSTNSNSKVRFLF